MRHFGLFSTTVITSWCFKLISPFKSSNNVSFSFMMHFLRGSKSKTWCSCMLSGRIEYEFSRLINILPTHFRTAAVQNMTTSTSCFLQSGLDKCDLWRHFCNSFPVKIYLERWSRLHLKLRFTFWTQLALKFPWLEKWFEKVDLICFLCKGSQVSYETC